MKTIHLVVTTPDLKGILAVRSASGWRVPRVSALDTVSRVSVAGQLGAMLDEMTPADILHWAPLPWTDESLTSDEYCIAVARDANLKLNDDRDATIIDREQLLCETNLPAAERLAIQVALSRLEAPVAPFDSRAEYMEALAWGKRQFANATGRGAITATRFRGRRHDLVIRLQAGTDAAYLKAGWERVHDEAVLTQFCWALRPCQFPETLAVDLEKHRWLYRELHGTPLTHVRTRDTILAAVRALAALQTETLAVPAIASHVAPRRRTAVELFYAADAIVEEAWRSARPTSADAAVIDSWRTMSNAITRACADVDALDLPCALVLSDLSTDNILVTPTGIGFIDLLNAYWACPVLPLWRLVRDVERRERSVEPAHRASLRQAIVESFADEWERNVPAGTMIRAVAQLSLIGRVFSILMAACGLDRYEQALGRELPAGYRAARLETRVRDLLRSFAERTLVPRVNEPDAASALDLR